MRVGCYAQFTDRIRSVLSFILDVLISFFFGARHDPPRTDMTVLGDINPKRT